MQAVVSYDPLHRFTGVNAIAGNLTIGILIHSQWSDSDIRFPLPQVREQMSESKDHSCDEFDI